MTTPERTQPQLTIDLAAVSENVGLFVRRCAGDVMAVVKADAFGHGSVAVAETALASGARWLGVTSLDEALPLRRAGIRAPMLSWLNAVDLDVDAALRESIDMAVPSIEHLDAVASHVADLGVATTGPARLHLHVDCGMARDGAPIEVWLDLCRSAKAAQDRGLVDVVGVMGHLGCADDPQDACNDRGRARFDEAVSIARAVGLRPEHRHLAATAAALTDPRNHHTMCRIGAGLFGIDPSRTTALHHALTLRAPVISVRDVPAETAVGYGHTWRSAQRTRLALIPLGYADGLPRIASGHAEMWVHGRRRPVVGRISMDQAVLDVGDLPVVPGDMVTVFGSGETGEPTVADWARWAGTIEHEIVTGIGARVSRKLIHTGPRGTA